MARRSAGRPRSFRNDAQLKQYYLDGVVPTDKTLGVGSYGSVMEVEYKQVSCAAKRMHELLLDPGNDGVQETIRKYRQECQLMAGLRHPNITQFLGLCFFEGSELPLLVMEKLEMSVDDFLEYALSFPLPVKLSILTDTCSGLVYLHGMPSPIVHRDLTARNVLLTSSLTAKITDMGNSRIVSLRPSQLVQTMSKFPGTLVYMPPEALNDRHRYGSSLDVFSFGHLALYIFIQLFPGDLLSATNVDPRNPGHVISRTEVERRAVYMKKLKNQFMESYPILVELVTNCLHNNPQRRPSSEQLLKRLKPVKNEVEELYGGDVGKTMNAANLLHVKQMKRKNKYIEDLKASKLRLAAENAELTETNTRLENEKRSLESANVQITQEKEAIFNIKQELESENYLLVVENTQLKAENSRLKTDNERLHSFKSILKHEKHSFKIEVERLNIELKRATLDEKQSVNRKIKTFPLPLDWMRGPDMPVAMSGYIQSVDINGTLYVGGGASDSDEDEYLVMAYNTHSCQWATLPQYTTCGFAMTSINSKLVLVGGQAKDDYDEDMQLDINELGQWEPDSNQWTHPFPPMSTPRYTPSATSCKHWLVVAGGSYRGHLQSSVELLDVSNMQWSTGPSTPVPWTRMNSTTLGNTWYLMGGWCDDVSDVASVYSISLEALVLKSTSESYNIWKKLPSLNYSYSYPLIVEESLLAVGGRGMKSAELVSSIQRYVPDTNTWVPAGLLPHAVCDCTCIIASDKVHIIGGDDGIAIVNSIFTSNYF